MHLLDKTVADHTDLLRDYSPVFLIACTFKNLVALIWLHTQYSLPAEKKK